MHHPSCPACAGDWKPQTSASGQYVTCSACQAWIADGESAEAAELYSGEYFQGGEYLDYERGLKVHSRNFLRKLGVIGRLTGWRDDWSGVRAIEIGSADGEFLSLLQARGARGVGLEVSEHCRKKARDRGVELHSPEDSQWEHRARELRPNLLVAWDAWEHLPRPTDVFDRLLSLASPDCWCAVSTVDAGSWVPRLRKEKWRQFHPPTHLVYPTRASFEKYFASRGLRIRHHGGFGYTRPMAEYLVAAFPSARATICRIPGVFSIPFYLNLFDAQLVVASREGR